VKKDSALIQKDYSFLQEMSTEELQEILCRDMDLDRDESDVDLILNVMEVLDARENESKSEQDTENALVKLRELIDSRDAMFAEAVSSGKNNSSREKSGRNKRLWLRIGSIAAIVVLVISIGFTAANAKGYDLWGGMVRWTKETFSFGEKKAAFSTNETFEELKEALIQNGITIPVLPTWLQEQYTFDDIRVYSEPSGCRITAIATSNENTLFYQLTSINENDPGDRKYEINGDSVQQYDVNGITHYYMTNEDSVLIIWANNNCQIMMEFSDSNIDAQKIIDSIYVG
jgi:hypothetical protein